MKVTLKDSMAFLKTYNILKTKETLSIKTSYKLIQLFNKCQDYMDFYRERFEKIINEYAKRDEEGNILIVENGQGVQIKEGMQDKCLECITELDLFEVDLPNLKFTIDEFETISLSPEDLEVLTLFLEM